MTQVSQHDGGDCQMTTLIILELLNSIMVIMEGSSGSQNRERQSTRRDATPTKVKKQPALFLVDIHTVC